MRTSTIALVILVLTVIFLTGYSDFQKLRTIQARVAAPPIAPTTAAFHPPALPSRPNVTFRLSPPSLRTPE